jgi:cytoskeletal protein CcmA (bactofilin family)
MIFGKGKKDLELNPFKRPLESAALNRWRSVERGEDGEEDESDKDEYNTRDITLKQDQDERVSAKDPELFEEYEFSSLSEEPELFSSENVAQVKDGIHESSFEFYGDRRGEELSDQETLVNLSTVVEETTSDADEISEYHDPVSHAAPERQEAPKPPRERTPASDFSVSVDQDIANRFGTNLKSALGSGTVIEGMFSFENPVKIDGIMRGEIKSSSALIVGPKAQVSARIQVGSLIVLGAVEGEIEAEDLIEIRKTGSLEGDVVTRRLALEEGGVFNGACTMID